MTTIYGTASGFRTYLSARGLTATNSSDDAKVNAKLLVSSEWLDAKYANLFPGRRVLGRNQEREWPRNGASDIYGYSIPNNVIPTEVENATYEAAMREMNSPGGLSKDFTPSKYRRAAVSGAVSVEYAPIISSSEVQVQLQIVDEILSPILRSDGGSFLSGSSGRA